MAAIAHQTLVKHHIAIFTAEPRPLILDEENLAAVLGDLRAATKFPWTGQGLPLPGSASEPRAGWILTAGEADFIELKSGRIDILHQHRDITVHLGIADTAPLSLELARHVHRHFGQRRFWRVGVNAHFFCRLEPGGNAVAYLRERYGNNLPEDITDVKLAFLQESVVGGDINANFWYRFHSIRNVRAPGDRTAFKLELDFNSSQAEKHHAYFAHFENLANFVTMLNGRCEKFAERLRHGF